MLYSFAIFRNLNKPAMDRILDNFWLELIPASLGLGCCSAHPNNNPFFGCAHTAATTLGFGGVTALGGSRSAVRGSSVAWLFFLRGFFVGLSFGSSAFVGPFHGFFVFVAMSSDVWRFPSRSDKHPIWILDLELSHPTALRDGTTLAGFGYRMRYFCSWYG